MAGRPTKLTPATTERLVQAISVGATYEHACGFAGIDYDTFNRWMKQGAAARSGTFFEFYGTIKKAEAQAVVKWSALIDKAANDGEWQAAAWKLERRYPHIYGRRVQETEHSGQVKVIVAYEDGADNPETPASGPGATSA